MAEHEGQHNNAGKTGWVAGLASLIGAGEKAHHAFPLLGPIGGVMGGIAAADEASQEFHEGHYLNGALRTGQSLLEFGAAGAETYGMFAGAGTAAAGTAGTVGAVLGGAALGIGAGMGMEEATKYANVFHDDQGRAITGAEKVAGWGNAVSQWIDPAKGTNVNGGSEDGLLEGNFSGQGLRSSFATAAGINTTILGQVIGAGLDIYGTGVAAGKYAFGYEEPKKPADGAPFAHYAD